MLWTFDGAHIPYPGMSSGAPNFNLVAAAPLAPQFNVAESVSGPAIRRSHRGFRILNYVLRLIFYTKLIVTRSRSIASLSDEIETMRCYLMAPERSEYMVITLVNQFLEVVDCLMDLLAMRWSVPRKAKQIEEVTAKVEDISRRIVPYHPPIEAAGRSRMHGAGTLCTAAHFDYISALMKKVFCHLKVVGDAGLRICSQGHALFCENHEQNNSTCARNSEGSYCSSPQNNTTGGCRVQQHEKGRKVVSVKQRSNAGSVVRLHFSKNFSNDSCTASAPSTYGTSHLSRRLENVHQMDLSGHPEELTREIAENATPLTKNDKSVVDNELGEISTKRNKYTSGSKSEVWLHFEKLVAVEDSGVKAKCIYCDKVLKADSRRNGTSRLRRHITDFHKIKLARSIVIKKRQSKKKKQVASTHSQAKDQASLDCHHFNSIVRAASANGRPHQGLQFTAIAENPMPSTEKKSAEVEPGNKSRKHTECTSWSRSKVWLHFSRVVNIDDSCVIKAMCRHCGKLLRADSKINGTSRLRRHIIGCHKIELGGSVKTTGSYGNDSTVNQELTSIDNQAEDHAAAECRGIEHDKVPREMIVLDYQNSGSTISAELAPLVIPHWRHPASLSFVPGA
jgi:hypothetical protein